MHLNSVEWYLKETVPSNSLSALCVTATVLRRALFEAREKRKEKPPPNILIYSKEIDCHVGVSDGSMEGTRLGI